MSDVSIHQAQKELRALGSQICALLQAFEVKHSVRIENVSLHTVPLIGGRPAVADVVVEARL